MDGYLNHGRKATGSTVTIEIGPQSQVVEFAADAAIVAGKAVALNTDGTVGTGGIADNVIGVALEAADAADDVIRVCVAGRVKVASHGITPNVVITSAASGAYAAKAAATDADCGFAVDANWLHLARRY